MLVSSLIDLVSKMNVCTIVYFSKMLKNALDFFKFFLVVKYYKLMLAQMVKDEPPSSYLI